MFDRMRGRVLGVNIVDLLVVLIVVFAVFSYVSKPDESTYGGNQMYSAIQDFQRLDSRGFFVEAEINGTYLWDNTPFKKSGLLLSSSGGRLRLKTTDGTIYVIGGERAYLEDVAASSIKMEPVDSYLVVFNLDEGSYDGFSDLLAYLESVKSEMNADHFYVDVEIAVDAPMTPAERQVVYNEFTGLYLVRNNYFSRTEPDGFVMNLVKAELGELSGLSIPPGKITTGRIRAFAGYASEPEQDFPGDYHIVAASDLLL
ncbi:hypothetical protein BMS3Abin16_00228 [archaeon BMS3Abin16]|nr:hypothetical protein BMS3Abin16_00228 [archaeon BMS3Abin16]